MVCEAMSSPFEKGVGEFFTSEIYDRLLFNGPMEVLNRKVKDLKRFALIDIGSIL